jgi:hypothetical protein
LTGEKFEINESIPITWVERTASKVSVVPAVGEYLAQLRGLRSELKAVRLL